MRSYVLADEAALLMASYPHARPGNPFPYFTEVMTGFEYAAAIGMLYEGQEADGLSCIRDIRGRYDGRKRSPFDEAECGHHYARAMAFTKRPGRFFWSNGTAWGTVDIRQTGGGWQN